MARPQMKRPAMSMPTFTAPVWIEHPGVFGQRSNSVIVLSWLTNNSNDRAQLDCTLAADSVSCLACHQCAD